MEYPILDHLSRLGKHPFIVEEVRSVLTGAAGVVPDVYQRRSDLAANVMRRLGTFLEKHIGFDAVSKGLVTDGPGDTRRSDNLIFPRLDALGGQLLDGGGYGGPQFVVAVVEFRPALAGRFRQEFEAHP